MLINLKGFMTSFASTNFKSMGSRLPSTQRCYQNPAKHKRWNVLQNRKLLTIFATRFISDVWQYSAYTSAPPSKIRFTLKNLVSFRELLVLWKRTYLKKLKISIKRCFASLDVCMKTWFPLCGKLFADWYA